MALKMIVHCIHAHSICLLHYGAAGSQGEGGGDRARWLVTSAPFSPPRRACYDDTGPSEAGNQCMALGQLVFCSRRTYRPRHG